MPSQKNIDQVTQLKDQISQAKSIVLADYHGLSVPKQQELRGKIKQVKGKLTIAKNTLIKIALKDRLKDLSPSLKQALQGATAMLTASEDEIGPIKAMVEFAKENELPKVKAGILFTPRSPALPAGRLGEVGKDRILSVEEVNDLASLPGRLELQAKLVGTLNAPVSNFANVLGGNLRKLVLALQAIKQQKEKAN